MRSDFCDPQSYNLAHVQATRPDRALLSVVIPTLKSISTARLLAQRIQSLTSRRAVEVIIVSPCLPSEAPERTGDDGIRYLADRGRGVYAAYTQGLRAAKGEYVWFVGDDDYPLDAAARLPAILSRGDADVLVAPVVLSTGRVYRPERARVPLFIWNWCQQGVVYRRSALARLRFFRRMRTQADHYVNIQLRLDPSMRIAYLDVPLCVFGTQGLSSCITTDHAFVMMRRRLARRLLSPWEFIGLLTLLAAREIRQRAKKLVKSGSVRLQ